MKRGFSLIEMLVVIGILGILMSVLIVHVTGGTDTARNAQCLSNMANLARGCSQYGTVSHYYPLAGSVEKMTFDESSGIRNARMKYSELPGWISWASQGSYKSSPRNHTSSYGWFTSAYYDSDDKVREYALTNGVLWKYVSGNASCYRCPCHLIKLQGTARPNWSYVMNSYFGWDDTLGSSSMGDTYHGQHFTSLSRADRRLLFAELKWESWQGEAPNFTTAAGTEADCVLQYSSDEGGETIAWNHKSGRDKVAHVAFADGHVDKIVLPKAGMSDSDARQLTKWLCTGTDISFDGKKYREVK